ncbi:helix-turn-helix domain-containing protein [Streptomyces sp. MBT53]|uniref:AfsR/SARP family transcriptional regulator n=1 Tax=Streptomyces sp. MBT53 TaxID=1488384 RepID=UPI0019148DEE|nr:winged helix-turn-helix domain-containing protein [Streptomyces sp. MBT53]
MAKPPPWLSSWGKGSRRARGRDPRGADLAGWNLVGLSHACVAWVVTWCLGGVDRATPVKGLTGQGRVRTVCAVDAGRAVPLETLMRRVWGEDPPEGSRSALYAHVARIRRVLAATGAVRTPRLLRRNGGYVLDTDSEEVDLHRFSLPETCRNLAACGPPSRA